jgi:hypothetical protein
MDELKRKTIANKRFTNGLKKYLVNFKRFREEN